MFRFIIKGDENTVESYFHIGADVGSNNCALRTKLGLLDPYHGITDLYE